MHTHKVETKSFRELLSVCLKYGNKPALTDSHDGRSISYKEVAGLSHEFAQKLPSTLQPGSRVLLYDLDPLDWVPLFFSVILRGCIAVPLDTRVSKDFFDAVLKLTEPSLILCGDATELSSNSNVLRISGLKELQRDLNSKLPETDIDSPAEIIFTSGTWSLPKGVVLSQRNIVTNAHQVLQMYSHTDEDTSLAVLPLSHAYQQTVGLVLPLIAGSQIVFLKELSSQALTNALHTYTVRTMLVVPRVLTLIESSILRKIRSHKKRKVFVRFVHLLRFLPIPVRRFILKGVHEKIGSHLKTLVVGGAPLPQELDRFFQGLGYRIVVGYGASECSPVISISLNQHRVPGEVGIPVPGMSMKLNEKSEIMVQGENLFLGYWPAIDRPGVFNTEDVAIQAANGSFVLRGRTKNLVVYPSGDKIFCEDIEHIANQIPDVEDSCVVEIFSPNGITLHCAVKGGPALSGRESEITENINAQLPFGIRLERVVLFEREEFPYTHTLKPNRKAIQELCSTNVPASTRG